MKRSICIAVLLWSSNALAEDTEQAKTFFEAGKAAYSAGLFEGAISAFENAYRLAPRSTVLFSLAQAHRQQYLLDQDPQRLVRAVELFRLYVKEVPKGGRSDHARQHLASLEPALRKIEAAGPIVTKHESAKTRLLLNSRTPGATVLVDGDEPLELPTILEVSPGPHKLRFEAEGYVGEEVDTIAVEGQMVPVDVPLRERPGRIALNAPVGAQITLDGRVIGPAPLSAPLDVAAGRHVIAVSEPGHYAWARDVTLERGQEIELKAELDTTKQRTLSYLILGFAGVMAAGSVTSGVIAAAAERRAKEIDDLRLDKQSKLEQAQLDEYQSALDRRDKAAPVAYALMGTALAAGVTGLLLYVLDSPRLDAEALGITPVAGGGSATLRF